MSTKAELRRRFRAAREALPQAQVDADSESIRGHVLELPELVAARSVFVYASTASEVQTLALIEDLLALHKTVAVPRITDRAASAMEAVVIRSLKDLTPSPGSFDLLTPRGRETLEGPAEVTLLPGLAFSPLTGARLGMGGGYYDRYFASAAGHASFRIALAFEHQLADVLPVEPHDHAVHAIVTPYRVHRVNAPA